MRSTGDGPAPIDASLHLLADHLLDSLGSGEFPPSLLHVSTGTVEGFELGMLPLDGRHPTDLLVGMRAPDAWHAIGMACGGWAYPSSERGRADRRRSRVNLVTLLSRTGELAHRARVEDAGAIGMPHDEMDEPPNGEQVDLLRLALGLDTDPPPCDAGVFWAIHWLSAILARRAGALADWSAVAELHPAVGMLSRASPPDEASPASDDLVDIAGAFARIFSWRALRRGVIDDRFDVEDLLPEDGEWFDDGAFARYLLNRCPPLAQLRRAVDDHLPRDLAERLRATLELLEVPHASWPDVSHHAA